jgi:membrane-bound lytic murein transglycosylase D
MSVVRRQQALKLPVDYDHLNLPRVIQAYIAKLMAWRELIANYERYKITLPTLAFEPYFIEVAATHNIDINIAADLAEISVGDFLSGLRVKPRRSGRGCKRGRRSLPFFGL